MSAGPPFRPVTRRIVAESFRLRATWLRVAASKETDAATIEELKRVADLSEIIAETWEYENGLSSTV